MRFDVDDDLAALGELVKSMPLSSGVDMFKAGALWALARVTGCDVVELEARLAQLSASTRVPASDVSRSAVVGRGEFYGDPILGLRVTRRPSRQSGPLVPRPALADQSNPDWEQPIGDLQPEP